MSLVLPSLFLSFPSFHLQFVFFAGGRVLPKHNAEGPAGAAAEVQVDQAGQGGRDVGPVVSGEREEWESQKRFTQFNADIKGFKGNVTKKDVIDRANESGYELFPKHLAVPVGEAL